MPLCLEICKRPYNVFSTHLKYRNSILFTYSYSFEIVVGHSLENNQRDIKKLQRFFLNSIFTPVAEETSSNHYSEPPTCFKGHQFPFIVIEAFEM